MPRTIPDDDARGRTHHRAAAVRHVFACPSLSALRDSLGIEGIADLSSAPERALRYFRAYLEWAPG